MGLISSQNLEEIVTRRLQTGVIPAQAQISNLKDRNNNIFEIPACMEMKVFNKF
jgi:hypothetical protein